MVVKFFSLSFIWWNFYCASGQSAPFTARHVFECHQDHIKFFTSSAQNFLQTVWRLLLSITFNSSLNRLINSSLYRLLLATFTFLGLYLLVFRWFFVGWSALLNFPVCMILDSSLGSPGCWNNNLDGFLIFSKVCNLRSASWSFSTTPIQWLKNKVISSVAIS